MVVEFITYITTFVRELFYEKTVNVLNVIPIGFTVGKSCPSNLGLTALTVFL
jgi:hypothetical protein